jgi:uncharacterized damage-inducible protein DinB
VISVPLDPFRHNSWATRQLLAFCRRLSDEQLAATAPGALGSLLDTLRHIVTIDGGYYRMLLTGAMPDWDWHPDEAPGLDVLEWRAEDSERFWERYLQDPIDPERVITEQIADGVSRETKVGVLLTQVLQHACEHRGQACTIVTSLGLQPPDLQGWAYGVASGRCVIRRAADT